MRTRLGVRLAFISLAVLVAWGALAGSEERVTHFAFTLQTETGLTMKCETGCAWEKLSYSCGEKVPCCARVDERGVRGIPCAAEGK